MRYPRGIVSAALLLVAAPLVRGADEPPVAEAKPLAAPEKPAELVPAEARPAEAKPEEAKPEDAKAAEVADEDAGDPESSRTELSAGDRKALDEFLTKATRSRRAHITSEIRRLVKATARVLKLDDEVVEKLTGLESEIVDEVAAEWSARAADWLTPYLAQSGDGAAELESWNAEEIARDSGTSVFVSPADAKAWTEGLKKILTVEQLTTLESTLTEERTKILDQTKDAIAVAEEQVKMSVEANMDTTSVRVVQYLLLDEKRQETLKAAGDAAVKAVMDDWRKYAERTVLNMDERTRKMLLDRNSTIGNPGGDLMRPEKRTAWVKGMATLLTPEERTALKEGRAEARRRRAEALAMILVGELDRLTGFTEAQRDRLTEILAPHMQRLPDTYFEQPPGGGYYSLDMGRLLQEVHGPAEKEVAAALSEDQVKRLQKIEPDQLGRNRRVVRSVSSSDKTPPDIDELGAERLISGFLHTEAGRLKEQMKTWMEARLATLCRVVNPDEKVVAELRTAAKGAAEELKEGSMQTLDAWVRRQFMGVKPADVPARVKNLYNPYQNARDTRKEPELWTSTVDRLLTAEQKKAWEAECATTRAWQNRATCRLVISEVEKRVALGPEKREALAVEVTEIVDSYEKDFEGFLSPGWHLQGYYSLVPLAVLTNEKLDELLGKPLALMVREKCLGNVIQYGDMLRQRHERRLKTESKSKSK